MEKHEATRRAQQLIVVRNTLETISPGAADEIDRVVFTQPAPTVMDRIKYVPKNVARLFRKTFPSKVIKELQQRVLAKGAAINWTGDELHVRYRDRQDLYDRKGVRRFSIGNLAN